MLRINNDGSKEQRGHKCHEITNTFMSYNLSLISLCPIVPYTAQCMLTLVFILVRRGDEVSRVGPRQRGDASEAGEWAGGSVEASSAAPDLITSDRSFISQPLSTAPTRLRRHSTDPPTRRQSCQTCSRYTTYVSCLHANIKNTYIYMYIWEKRRKTSTCAPVRLIFYSDNRTESSLVGS